MERYGQFLVALETAVQASRAGDWPRYDKILVEVRSLLAWRSDGWFPLQVLVSAEGALLGPGPRLGLSFRSLGQLEAYLKEDGALIFQAYEMESLSLQFYERELRDAEAVDPISAVIERLAGPKRLRSLRLTYYGNGNRHSLENLLKGFAKRPEVWAEIEHLELGGFSDKAAAGVRLAEVFPKLRSLSFEDSQLSVHSARWIGEISELRQLRVRTQGLKFDTALRPALRNLEHLEDLTLEGDLEDGAWARWVALRLPRLKRLRLEGMPADLALLRALAARLPELESLELGELKGGREALLPLFAHPRLRWVSFSGSAFRSEAEEKAFRNKYGLRDTLRLAME